MIRPVLVLATLAVSFPLAARHSPLAAQQPADTTRFPDLVVTANRFPVPAESVAATLTVLTGEELRSQGLRFVGDALRQVPGVQIVQSGSFGATTSLFLRGGQSDYVKVLVDGVPVNQPGGAYDFAYLSTDNVERIEILRGPASVLYGSDAVSGVVHVITRGGGRERVGTRGLAVDAAVEAGTYGTVRWEGAGRGGADAVDFSASLSRFTTDGSYEFNNDFRNTVASGLLRARPGPRTGAALALRWSDGLFRFPTDFTGAVVDRNQFATDEETTISLDVAHRLLPPLEARLLVGRQNSSVGSDDRPDPPPGPTSLFVRRSDVERWSADARLVFSGLRQLVAMAGVGYDDQQESSVSESDFGFGSSTDRFEASRENWGFYFEGSLAPTPRVRLTAGGRIDDNERFGTFETWRVSALAFAAPATRLRASAGSAFKEPTFFENFATGFVVGNPDLRPERSTSVEAGVEQTLATGRVTLGVTGFRQRFRDIIQFTFAPPAPGDPNYFNIARASADGIETAVEVRDAGPLAGGVAYTWLHTRVTDAGFDTGADAEFVAGEPLIRRPEHSFSMHVRTAWRLPVRLGAVLTWVGGREDLRFTQFPEPTRRIELPSYVTLDVSGTVTVLQPRRQVPGVGLRFRVENVFDESYEQAAGFPARGRVILVGVTSAWR
ncbi:MAG TPA: TonB-dependent receptor [Gemmatimonadales bacterium]|nr:TonB-dependent receptor [Gemmatimonadales bacterium]